MQKKSPWYIALDLLDAEDSRRKLEGLHEVTHIFYTAYQDRPTWAELVPSNLAMLHLGPFKTPARGSDHMPPEFNIDKQNFLEARQR